MSIEITPELLAAIENKAKDATQGEWPQDYPQGNDLVFIAAANPSVILALIEHIKQMKREQVWLAEQILCCSDEKSYCSYDCDRCFNIDTVEGWLEEANKETSNGNTDNTKPTE